MAKTAVGLFDGRKQALTKVLDDLAKAGFAAEDVSTVRTSPSNVLEDAGKGAYLGGFVGLLVGATALLIPGIGWVAVAGPLAAMLTGAAVGAAAGGLIGALIGKGVPEEHAHFFAEGLRRGGVLVIVHARNDEQAQLAEEVMKRNGAVDIQERRDQWMGQGWKGRFDAREGEALLTREEEEGPYVPLAAVCVYEVVIALPARYGGPERRKAARAFSGTDRRAA